MTRDSGERGVYTCVGGEVGRTPRSLPDVCTLPPVGSPLPSSALRCRSRRSALSFALCVVRRSPVAPVVMRGLGGGRRAPRSTLWRPSAQM